MHLLLNHRIHLGIEWLGHLIVLWHLVELGLKLVIILHIIVLEVLRLWLNIKFCISVPRRTLLAVCIVINQVQKIRFNVVAWTIINVKEVAFE